jgi:acetyl esterase
MNMLPEVHCLLAMLDLRGESSLRELPAERARLQTDAIVGLLDLPPVEPASIRDVRVTESASVRLYHPADRAVGPVVMYLHGGGWMVGSLDTHDSLCRYLALRLGLRVVSVHYRRAPEHVFPAAYDDCLACLEWLLDSPGELGAKVAAVGLAGDSAGGNLAAAISATARSRIKAQLLLYPVLDLARRSASYAAFSEGCLLEWADMEHFIHAYVPCAADRLDPRVSPLLAQHFGGLPPTVLLTAGLDVLRDEGRAYAARLVSEGVPVKFHEAEGLIHGMATYRAALPSAVPILDRCLADLKGYLLA